MDEKTATIAEIQARTGWNDDTLLMFTLLFISATGLTEDFEEYLKEKEDEEAAECASPPDDHPDAQEN